MPSITPAAQDALRRATITETTLDFPPVDPKTYKELKAIVERTGGRWVRARKTHVYATDPRPVIAALIETGDMPRDADKDAAFWRTPPEVIDALLTTAGPFGAFEVRALEPSAGDGAIAEAIRALAVPGDGEIDLTCVEPDAGRHATLLAKGFKAEQTTFEAFAATEPEFYDAIVMNPPFATAGHPTLWAEHVLLAWDLLAPGGTLAAVVPNNLDRTGEAPRRLRPLVDLYGDVEPLPEGSFKPSGTGVRTALLYLTR